MSGATQREKRYAKVPVVRVVKGIDMPKIILTNITNVKVSLFIMFSVKLLVRMDLYACPRYRNRHSTFYRERIRES